MRVLLVSTRLVATLRSGQRRTPPRMAVRCYCLKVRYRSRIGGTDCNEKAWSLESTYVWNVESVLGNTFGWGRYGYIDMNGRVQYYYPGRGVHHLSIVNADQSLLHCLISFWQICRVYVCIGHACEAGCSICRTS